MKSVNSKVKVEVNDDKVTFSTENDSRTLRYNSFHGKVSFYMDGPKGFLVVEDLPKLRRDKNVLILDVGSGFYNVEFICFTVEEMQQRMNELKNIITTLYQGYLALIESSKNNQKNYTKGKFKSFKRSNDNEFNSIQLPEELNKLGQELYELRYNKTLTEYLNDLINLYENNGVAKIVGDKIRFSSQFIETIDAIRYLLFK